MVTPNAFVHNVYNSKSYVTWAFVGVLTHLVFWCFVLYSHRLLLAPHLVFISNERYEMQESVLTGASRCCIVDRRGSSDASVLSAFAPSPVGVPSRRGCSPRTKPDVATVV
jgi:hypothetical protein